ncbi:hypothetical protein L1987_03105 [Smallanthus sonchifolius]|uniref:Uncharacterized protein n=1 Tax=Smallanthus sonchifolius TaxID=185202 RepID=A0ACB9K9L9_9ASTR|nr:hypothetical protein L1987_03105 [Smallanthus sonchifolius]
MPWYKIRTYGCLTKGEYILCSTSETRQSELRRAMDIDLPTKVGPAEETVDALLEYLVGPLLPLKHSDTASDTSSEAQQESVAKQVHAAAVLYNLFHLNHHRESQFLNFNQFCNLAITFKPSILHHMKYMCQPDRPILDDPENQLSLTEKAIMDACTMSETLLNASDDISNIIKEWPITKVAVLLVDSKKENCFLKFNNRVWSVIEKDLYPESKKRKRTMINNDEEGEAGFQKLAFSAVKEVTGNVNGELKVLESHVVYSLSQVKTATLFYIVQSTQSISEVDLVPIQDAICSLQGPVVKESLGSWVVTPVVEYCYLLPYAEIISKFFSRVSNSLSHHVEKINSQKSCEKVSGENKKVSDDFQIKSKLDSESVHASDSSKEEPHDSKFTKNIFKSNNSSNDAVTSWLIEGPFDQQVKETKNSTDNGIMDASSDCTKKDMNDSCRVESNNSSFGANSKSTDRPIKVYRHEKKSTPTNSISSKENLKDLKKMSTISQSKDERVDGENKSYMVSPNMDRTLTVNHALEDFHSIVDAKRSELSEAALRALLNKRQKLHNQQEVIEDELTLCDKKIQEIMHGGVGDCLSLKLEAIIDCCNEICKQDDMQTQEHTNLHVARSLSSLSGKSLSEAQLTLRKACQELDDICLSNNWMLPTYHTSLSDGGFVANVTVKGTNFECSGVSGIQPSIHEARNSAATHAITRLQLIANEMNTTLV